MELPNEEKVLTCVEEGCGNEYTLSVGEQRFFIDKGFYLPKRCEDCRARRRKEKQERLRQKENEN